jgi:hypothetical protein
VRMQIAPTAKSLYTRKFHQNVGTRTDSHVPFLDMATLEGTLEGISCTFSSTKQ